MLITIVTITYNSETTLFETLNSILSQTYKNIQHVIIDGNSYDNTWKILDKYKKIKKNSVIKHVNDKGIFDAMNFGLKFAKGKFVTFLNSDDIFESNNSIENIVNIIKKNPKNDIFFGDVNYFKSNPKNIIRNYSGKNFLFNDFSYGLMPPHPGCFVRTTLHKKYKFNNNLKIAGDFDL